MIVPVIAALVLIVPTALAIPPADSPQQAAAPLRADEGHASWLNRTRLCAGLAFEQTRLEFPGGRALGPLFGLAWERPSGELTLALGALFGPAAEDSTGRVTGLSSAHLRATWRAALSPSSSRIFLEVGARAGFDNALGSCDANGCTYRPASLEAAVLAGSGLHLTLGHSFFTLGSNLMLFVAGRGVSGTHWTPQSPFGSRLGLQLWLESGFGGGR